MDTRQKSIESRAGALLKEHIAKRLPPVTAADIDDLPFKIKIGIFYKPLGLNGLFQRVLTILLVMAKYWTKQSLKSLYNQMVKKPIRSGFLFDNAIYCIYFALGH